MPDPDLARSPSVRHVFVYGTLRQGECNDINRLAPPPRWIGAGSAAATLFHLGNYPGAVLGGDALVIGEIYAIDAALEARLDAIECIAGTDDDEYFKREIDVATCAGEVRCLVYEINPKWLDGRLRIDGGDWVRFRTQGPPPAIS